MDAFAAISQIGSVASTVRSLVDAVKGKSHGKANSNSSNEFATALNNYLSLYDKNGDGVLSRAEFTGNANVFTRLDVNGDGRLDARELLPMFNGTSGGAR